MVDKFMQICTKILCGSNFGLFGGRELPVEKIIEYCPDENVFWLNFVSLCESVTSLGHSPTTSLMHGYTSINHSKQTQREMPVRHGLLVTEFSI